MSIELLSALALFALVASITPGPNNLMLMASGANFGFVRSIPHMAGICAGFVFMLVLVGLGLAGIFDLVPYSQLVLKVASIAYMLFLAFKIATAAPPKEGEATGKPFTFFQAAAFQWVNPKAWAMALGAISIYAPEHKVSDILLVGAVFGVVNLPSITCWTVLGLQMRKMLTSHKRLRAFNILMAGLLVLSLVVVL